MHVPSTRSGGSHGGTGPRSDQVEDLPRGQRAPHARALVEGHANQRGPQTKPADKEGPARLALSKAQAAEALGVSVDFLERHVMPELRVVRRGGRRLIPISELDRWLDANAARALDRI